MGVHSRRINGWAIETAVDGPITAAAIVEAAEQARVFGGQFQVWVLDASRVTDFDVSTLPEIQRQTESLRVRGLDRIAIVLPAQARVYVGFIQLSLHDQIHVFPFDSEAAALEWIGRGCR